MLNHYNIFAPHSQCHIIRSASYFFGKKIYWSDNTVLLSLSRFIYNAFIDIGTNFGVISPKLSDSAIKELVWNSFATSVEL